MKSQTVSLILLKMKKCHVTMILKHSKKVLYSNKEDTLSKTEILTNIDFH